MCGIIDKSICRLIKDYDRFGHPVKLNFNKNGPTHNTFVGGIGSIVFYLVVFIVVITSLTASDGTTPPPPVATTTDDTTKDDKDATTDADADADADTEVADSADTLDPLYATWPDGRVVSF